MNDEKLSEIAMEVERQNHAFARFEAELRSLGDVELAVPKVFLAELAELAARGVTTTTTMPAFGIRA